MRYGPSVLADKDSRKQDLECGDYHGGSECSYSVTDTEVFIEASADHRGILHARKTIAPAQKVRILS